MNRFCVGSCILVFAAGCGDTTGAAPDAGSFVGAILGQSNALGMGLDTRRPEVPGVRWREHSDGVTVVVNRNWGELSVRPNGRFGAEFGIAAAAGDGVTLEKYARGGSSLAPGGATPAWLPSAHELYDGALAFLRAGPTPNFVLWWQGETDASNKQAAVDYGANLTTLTETLRADLNAPELIVVTVLLRKDFVGVDTAFERATVERWVSDRNRIVNVDDVPVGADGIHYDGAALDEVGRRAWKEYLAP